MVRIYAIYWVKRAVDSIYLRLGALAACAAVLLAFVSFRSVISNIPAGSLAAMGDFALGALRNTELAVKLSLLAGAFLLWKTILDLFRYQKEYSFQKSSI